ncbi:transcription-repair coupling factor [Georgenia halophila]|uniref:Transcription-repair-coupling factor n=1 Tax=Georgenia halophila TaxID=620889 RepID=A0ABP8L5S7_9MICO
MKLTGLLPLLRRDPAVADALRQAREPVLAPMLHINAALGVRAPLAASITEHRPVLIVTATGREADEAVGVLRNFLPEHDVAAFPAWETLPHERLSPRSDTVAKRLAVLRRLAHPGAEGTRAGPIRVLVVPVRALLQPVVTGLGDLEPVALRVGEERDLEQLAADLVAAAYTRVDMVERRGEFAVRGGILDVFPPTEDHPLRLEFFGDEVEEIRSFAVADQRSLDAAEELWAPPCRELLLNEDVRARAARLVEDLPGARDMLERLSEGIAVEGMESLAPVLAPGMEPVLDLVPDGTLVVLSDPERVRRRAHDLVATTEEFLSAAWASAAQGGKTPLDLRAASFADLAEARALALTRGLGWWSFSALPSDAELDMDDGGAVPDGDGRGGSLAVDARDVERYAGDVERALKDLTDLVHQGWRLVVTTEGPGPARRMTEQLAAADVPARLVEEIADEPPESVVLVTTAATGRSFVAPELRLALITESDITGRAGTSTRDMRRMPSRRRNVVGPLALRAGDHVVHEQHGVGRFVDLVKRTVGKGPDATSREYLVIEYAASKRGHPGDRLFVPTDSLDQVTKYTGGESPTLSKMGGGDWAKTKASARKAVRKIASELIRLYAARMSTKGHAFAPDTPWQRELEDAFPYMETPDQVVTIDEVKADMEKPNPMDRLISGDVGYGKTEIAIRAAFKAVQDGKQVAVLVPTTLLVQQHLDTFSERYAGFPVSVKALSRFQTDSEAQTVREGVRKGSVDVLIGTHRILTGEVRFTDLGLVIVDEEQRFGVEHKETLKQMRAEVDVLAMSATPIPRTLEMAITGIREMSTLATPPEERHPVLTYVGAYEEKQVAAAIRRELLREGQVFYVHNRVSSISKAASHLQELVPEARIGVAHGRMNEHQLEKVIQDFWNKEFDVLVCTTIVETGLDMSNANTLIVERGDQLGLSQAHQLRGRVGRGRERAYAYFFYPPERPLTETAHDRLATIAAHTDLGAGIQVAMKDLEIRGAGNLLGGEQSGQIAGVGFDLYVRMVSDAVAEFRGEKEEEKADVRVELPIDAHVPHDYISHERLRLEAYAKIAAAGDDASVKALREELVDRYGPVPEPVERLFAVSALRAKARAVGLTEITGQGKYVRFAPVDLPESAQLRLKRLYPSTVLKPAVRAVLVPFPMTARLGGKPLNDAALLEWVNELIDAVLTSSVSAAAAVGEKVGAGNEQPGRAGG